MCIDVGKVPIQLSKQRLGLYASQLRGRTTGRRRHLLPHDHLARVLAGEEPKQRVRELIEAIDYRGLVAQFTCVRASQELLCAYSLRT